MFGRSGPFPGGVSAKPKRVVLQPKTKLQRIKPKIAEMFRASAELLTSPIFWGAFGIFWLVGAIGSQGANLRDLESSQENDAHEMRDMARSLDEIRDRSMIDQQRLIDMDHERERQLAEVDAELAKLNTNAVMTTPITGDGTWTAKRRKKMERSK